MSDDATDDAEVEAAFAEVFEPQLAPLLAGLEQMATANPILAAGLREILAAVKELAKTSIKTEFDLTDQRDELARVLADTKAALADERAEVQRLTRDRDAWASRADAAEKNYDRAQLAAEAQLEQLRTEKRDGLQELADALRTIVEHVEVEHQARSAAEAALVAARTDREQIAKEVLSHRGDGDWTYVESDFHQGWRAGIDSAANYVRFGTSAGASTPSTPEDK